MPNITLNLDSLYYASPKKHVDDYLASGQPNEFFSLNDGNTLRPFYNAKYGTNYFTDSRDLLIENYIKAIHERIDLEPDAINYPVVLKVDFTGQFTFLSISEAIKSQQCYRDFKNTYHISPNETLDDSTFAKSSYIANKCIDSNGTRLCDGVELPVGGGRHHYYAFIGLIAGITSYSIV